MRRNIITAIVICLALGSLTTAQLESRHADVVDCGVCKSLSNINGMDRVQFETAAIDNGMITVMVVPDDMKDALAAAQRDVAAAIDELQSGKKMELCDSCKSIAKLNQAGAGIQNYKTDSVNVVLVTSDRPAVVKMIHEHARKEAGTRSPGEFWSNAMLEAYLAWRGGW